MIIRRVLVALVAAVALAACGQTGDTEQGTEAVPVPAPQPSTVALGQPFDVPGATGAPAAQVTLDEVDTAFGCPDGARYYGETPEPVRGHFIAVKMTVTTTATWTEQDYPLPGPFDYAITDPATGVTSGDVYAESGACVQDMGDIGRTALSPGRTFTGWVLLDAATNRGELLYRPALASGWPGVRMDLPTGG